LDPWSFLRFLQTLPVSLNLTFCESEANVARSLAQFSVDACFISAFSNHAVADACFGTFAGLGFATSCILRTEAGRLKLYFYKNGVNHRPSNVIYNHANSAVSLTPAAQYDWEKIFFGAG